MGSKTYSGVWFTCYSHDHVPPHVHAEYSGVHVIVELLPGGFVAIAKRKDAIRPRTAKGGHVRHTLTVAAENYTLLKTLWEDTHAQAD